MRTLGGRLSFFGGLMFDFFGDDNFDMRLHCRQGANALDPFAYHMRLNNFLMGKGDSSKSSNSKVLSTFHQVFVKDFH